MEVKWQIKRYENGDEKKMPSLFFESIGYTPKNESYWRWVHEENPAGPLVSYIATENIDSGVIGHYGLIPMTLKIDGYLYNASNSVHTQTGSDFRRQGIMTALAEKTYETAKKGEIDVTITFPNKEIYPFYKEKMPGYVELDSVIVMVRPVNFTGIFRRFWVPGIISKVFGSLFDAIFKSHVSIEIEEVESFGEELDEFWDSVSRDFKIIQLRDKKILNWRYVSDPVRSYRKFIARRSGKIAGYIVTGSIEYAGYKWGVICDYLAEPEDEETMVSLVSAATELFHREGCDFGISLILKSGSKYNPFSPYLKKGGYISVPGIISSHIYSHTFFVRNNTGVVSDSVLHEIKNWFINTSDAEFMEF